MNRSHVLLPAALICFAATAAAAGGQFSNAPNKLPAGVKPVSEIYYDGASDDLLTAGLGKTGLAGAAPPTSMPPTAAELRRLAIHTNYRAILDITSGGGYGLLYGPNIDVNGNDTLGEGKVPGWEYIAVADRGKSGRNVRTFVSRGNTMRRGA